MKKVFTAVSMKNGIFWDVKPCGSCKNGRFGGTSLGTANVFPSSPILVTLMIEGLRSSDTSAPTRTTRRNIPEDGILPNILLYVYQLGTV
jgi:hypothetical protein